MSDELLTVIEWALIPAGLLPIATAAALWRHRNDDSYALRDRAQVAIVLAGLGGVTALVAAFALAELPIGWLWIPFSLAILGADVVSGKWLVEYLRGRFR